MTKQITAKELLRVYARLEDYGELTDAYGIAFSDNWYKLDTVDDFTFPKSYFWIVINEEEEISELFEYLQTFEYYKIKINCIFTEKDALILPYNE